MQSAAFYFDLSSPIAYLAAERLLHVLPSPAEWQPVLACELPDAPRESGDPAFLDDAAEGEQVFRAEVARRARQLALQPLRWPDPFPFDSTLAMRVATYAKSIGRTVPFAQAAFRQAFAGGRSLANPDNVLIAAAACEMHPTAVLAAQRLHSVEAKLSRATTLAAQAGVRAVPAVRVGEVVFHGETAPEQAAAHIEVPALRMGAR